MSAADAPDWHGAIRILGRARLDDPAAAKAVGDAETARATAVQNLPAVVRAAQETEAALAAAKEKSRLAQEALDKEPQNAPLQKTRDDAQAQVAAATTAATSASETRAVAEEKLAQAQATLVAARLRLERTARELVREARGATIVWAGNPAMQMTPRSRIARTLTLSTIDELAPFQVASDLHRVVVNQGSQFFVPFTLTKQAGFDNNVNLTFVSPPTNVQVENKPIAKGATQQAGRVYVQANAPVGRFALLAQGQSPVAYSRNPQAAQAAKKAKEEADKAQARAAEAVKAAAEARAKAEQKAADAVTAAAAAADEQLKADQAAATAFANAAAAAETAARAATALAADAANEELKKSREEAAAAFAREAEAARVAAERKQAADKAAVAARSHIATTAEERADADKRAADADETLKAANARATAADTRAQEAAKVARPQTVNLVSAAGTIVVDVRPAAGTMALATPAGGVVKRGAALTVNATINRARGCYGPVVLSLALPPGVGGLSATSVTVPAEKNEGALTIQAADDAPLGQLQNVAVRGTLEFDGPAVIDQPLAIKVEE
ncbi:MAG: hypothetical protein ACT4QC_15680 [Planctomycetaceae bacterium]